MIIDTKLAVYKSNGNAELAKELLLMLIKDLPNSIACINQFSQLHKSNELKESVHRLHGSIAYCGVPDLKVAIINLENSINNNKFDINLKIEKLEFSINELIQHATTILQKQW